MLISDIKPYERNARHNEHDLRAFEYERATWPSFGAAFPCSQTMEERSP